MEQTLPTKYRMSKGVGYGKTRITAFDKALLNAGVGNYNLVRLSSILPMETTRADSIGMPMGSLLPIAYAEAIIHEKGIAKAAVAIGRPVDKSLCNVIMEYETTDPDENAEEIVRAMVEEGFKARAWELESIESVEAVAWLPDKGMAEYGVAFACVAEWS